MDAFTILLAKILPLYLLIFMGFFAGRFLQTKRETIALLLIYLIAPVVVFFGVVNVQLDLNRASIPVVMYIISCGICLLFFHLSGHFFKAPAKNILAFTSGSGNTGYFGLPVAIAIFGEQALGLAVLVTFGQILFENTLGFFITARGRHTLKESMKRVLRLPAVYAFALGVLANRLGLQPSQGFSDLGVNFRGAYSVLGMMMIGLGLSSVKQFKLDFKFIGIAFSARFLVWPLVTWTMVALDRYFLHFYDLDVHRMFLLLSVVPLAANTVAVAAVLDAEPEKAATAVFLSALVALVWIPVMVAYGL